MTRHSILFLLLVAGVATVAGVTWYEASKRKFRFRDRLLAVLMVFSIGLTLATAGLWCRTTVTLDWVQWLHIGPSVDGDLPDELGPLEDADSYTLYTMPRRVVVCRFHCLARTAGYRRLVAPRGHSDWAQLADGKWYEWRTGSQRTDVSLAIPFWLLCTIFLLSASACLLHLRHIIQSHAAGLCPRCGYDLRATPQRCPECGYVPTPVEADTSALMS